MLKFQFQMDRAENLHAFSLYFDATFTGSEKVVILNSGPEYPHTHW